MTPDIRAALREAADLLARVKPIDMNVGDDPHGIADRLRALADAPPTVAELLPMVNATRSLYWMDHGGDEWRAIHVEDADGASRVVIEFHEEDDKEDYGWFTWHPLAFDLTRPAALVEVTP